MKNLIFVIIAILYVLPVKAQKNNLAPSKPVTENYFGTKIIDEYRNLEDLQNAGTINWMQSQTNYTNSILNQIPKKNYYVEKRLEFDRRQGYSISDFEITDNDKYFLFKEKW